MPETSNPTPAQEEFQDFLQKNTDKGERIHPEDRGRDGDDSSQDEEDRYRDAQIAEAMRTPAVRSDAMKLPPSSFDSGFSTGVKGVIADARAYEQARQGKWRKKVRDVRRSVMGLALSDRQKASSNSSPTDSEEEVDPDEEAFLQQWRDARRLELENEAKNNVRSRRTSPSPRIFGRLDSVDALGYLDSIEKVGRETTVVVFVYDDEGEVSGMIEDALLPLVRAHPHVHFVKVHYEDIEFDNAAVPTVLAYRNQGDLFANLTGIIDMIPDDEDFDTESLSRLFKRNGVL